VWDGKVRARADMQSNTQAIILLITAGGGLLAYDRVYVITSKVQRQSYKLEAAPRANVVP